MEGWGDMKKILFIGNSHTYMNDMPQLAKEMMENVTGKPCEVFMLAYSGRPLKWHMEEEYFSVRFNILHGGYDYCIIQEQAHPMPPEEDTVKNAERIIELCRKAGTVPVIVETWAEKVKPENQAEMNRRYRSLADRQQAMLAAVGEVWAKALADIKDTDLYFRDGEHASPAGDYLAAMVITKTITGKLPDMDFRKSFDFTVPGGNWIPVNENTEEETVQLSQETVSIIRRYADEL